MFVKLPLTYVDSYIYLPAPYIHSVESQGPERCTVSTEDESYEIALSADAVVAEIEKHLNDE